jgi:uncharacterized membrane protein YeaQ/YmgE (transglycosylase-associated protein family)
MNPIIWAVIGGVLGLLAGAMMGSKGNTNRVENVLVGIFGAFLGGEFVAAMLADAPLPVAAPLPGAAAIVVPPTPITAFALMLAVGGAIVMLVLLRMVRGGVASGAAKPRKKNRN